MRSFHTESIAWILVFICSSEGKKIKIVDLHTKGHKIGRNRLTKTGQGAELNGLGSSEIHSASRPWENSDQRDNRKE